MKLPGARVTFAVLLLALMAAACGGGDSEDVATTGATSTTVEDAGTAAPASEQPSKAATEAPEPMAITVGGLGALSDAGIYIALEKGYFEEQALDVSLGTFTSALDEYPALATDQLQVTRSAQGAALYNAIAQDVGIVIVGDGGNTCEGFGYLGVVVRKELIDSGEVSEPADLAGKTIAVAGKGGTSDIVLERLLEEGGLGFDDIEHVELGFPEQLAAFGNDALDAAVMIEPTMTAGVSQDLTVMQWSGDEIYPCMQTAMLVYSPGFAEQTDAANRFAVAYLQGVRDYNNAFGPDREGFDEIVDILVTHTRVSDPAVYEDIVPVGLSPDGSINVEGLEDDLQFYIENGLVDDPPVLAEIIDNSFMEHAVEVLGPYEGTGG